MTALDPAEVFRQEASELFEALETTLLDLGLRPDDRDLVDSAFRALHTIKGSGAMFGFEQMAAFTHHVETVFDRVRKNEVAASAALIAVALTAKDYMRRLIEQPGASDETEGARILEALRRAVEIGRAHV